MMNKTIALCLDEESCRNPQLVGLDGEVLDAQEWLGLYSGAMEARQAIGCQPQIKEVWVVSCNDIDAINLAATLKSDRPDARVCLVTFDGCGSLYSRARTAAIDEVLEGRSFIRRYGEMKSKAHGSSARASRGFKPQLSLPSDSLMQSPAVAAGGQACSLPAEVRHKGFLLPVVSGSGGVGKSAVCTMMALSACARGFRTLLFDCDLQFGDVAAMVGGEEIPGVDKALAQPGLKEQLCQSPSNFTVLPCPDRAETGEVIASAIPALIDELEGCFDVIIVNTGSSWTELHASLLERSALTLFLVDQRSSSLRACRHALELCERCGIPSVPFRFALNRCVKNAPFTALDVSALLQGASVFELREGGYEVEECLAGGAAMELYESRNEFARSVDAMMDSLLPGGERPALTMPEDAGFLRRWRRGHRRQHRKDEE